MISFLMGSASVLIAFGLVIFVHEFGHFIVAKKSGVKVDRFSFGLGPELFGFTWGETRYCVAWIPLGGEVRMAGEMDPGAEPAAPRDPREFFAKPWYRRIPIVVAGPAMNYLLAFLLFSLVFFAWGNPSLSPDAVVGDVAEGFPAQSAGLRPGDRVLSIDGLAVTQWKDLAQAIHERADRPVTLEVRRAGTDPAAAAVRVQLTPRRDPATGHGLIGITPLTVYEKMGLWASFRQGGFQTVFWSLHTLDYLKDRLVRREKPELSGPVGIAAVISKSARSGLQDYIFLIAMISLGIGLFNLFPIPMLDGGHLMFYLIEGLVRRPVSRRVVQTANAVGLSVLLGILVFATYSDIQRLRGGDAPAATGNK